MFKKFIYVLLLCPALIFATETGEHLVHRFWTNTVAKNFTKVSSTISTHFQGTYRIEYDNQDENVTMTKTQLLQYLEGLDLTGYTITNLQSTRNEHNLIITYDIQLNRPLDKSYMLKLPDSYSYHEIFIYERKDDHWKLIASSFFPYNIRD